MCLRDIGHFGEKMGLLGKMSVQMGHFGENWAHTENECAKRTLGGNCLLGKIGTFRENECAKGATGVKTGFLRKISVMRGL